MPHQPHLMDLDPKEQLSEEEVLEKKEYKQRLAEALRDPELRKIEGFPIGDDDAILALSDPPHYTACPNPFLTEIVQKWQEERTQKRNTNPLHNDEINGYHREPYTADISEGKNNPIYMAHTYHTKVPHLAIMRYILHYTDPDDIVFDGFCGTGMTGVAAQLCGDLKEVEKLGYYVDGEGLVYENSKDVDPISRLGARKAILSDLSPAATFIAYNYNTPVDAQVFESEARRTLKEVEAECGWMYETWYPKFDSPERVKGKINFTVWSDVLVCPECGHEMIFWDVAIDKISGNIRHTWPCPECDALLGKSRSKKSGAQKVGRVWETVYDQVIGKSLSQAKQAPVLINYSVGKKRFEKPPDKADLELIERIKETKISYNFPFNELPAGFNTQQPKISHGLTHVHHFYTRRNLFVLAAIENRKKSPYIKFIISGSNINSSKLYRYRTSGKGGNVSGTLYIPSTPQENNIIEVVKRKLRDILKVYKIGLIKSLINCASSSDLSNTPSNSIDYIFVDPPFGGNLMYSELNYFWEAWLRVFTNNQPEAIINHVQRKGLAEYQSLMEDCFREFHRLLKHGHWMTVEFHNSKNAVWNSIQEALLRAGFMVADVRTLDKQQGTFKQVTTSAAVKQDLIISAYKPSARFEQHFLSEQGKAEGAWTFVRQHLNQLPMPTIKNAVLEPVQERYPYLLYDRMVAFHIQRGLSVPLSAPIFYQGLEQRFIDRDGMLFLSEQVPNYDKARMSAKDTYQMTIFVVDEKSTIQWLRQLLEPKLGGDAQTFAEIQPKFLKKLQQARYEQLPELLEILEQNFLEDAQGRWYVPDPNKASDLEKLRNKSLLREFNQYLEGRKQLKQFRTEAVRAGFADAWQRKDFKTIVNIAERLPEKVLQEDPDLLMYYDNASLRVD